MLRARIISRLRGVHAPGWGILHAGHLAVEKTTTTATTTTTTTATTTTKSAAWSLGASSHALRQSVRTGRDRSGNSHWPCSARWIESYWQRTPSLTMWHSVRTKTDNSGNSYSACPAPIAHARVAADSISSTAAFNACEKGQEWQLVFGLLSSMQQHRLVDPHLFHGGSAPSY